MACISRLSLTNFRSFEDLELELPPGVVVFFGANAQGKTTLLEAVYLLAIARSFRAENEREVVRFDAAVENGQALVSGEVQRQDGERVTVHVGYQAPSYAPGPSNNGPENIAPPLRVGRQDRGGSVLRGEDRRESVRRSPVRKEIRVNRVRTSAAGLVGAVNAVLFTAEDIQLVFGPPAGRRRYLNILLSQSDPAYLRALQRYGRVLQQRNRLLRMLRDGRADPDEMTFWNDELVREGAWITWRRHETIGELGPLCEERHHSLSGMSEEVLVQYLPRVPPGEDLADTERGFRGSLASAEARERATHTTAVGPHRDDLDLRIDGVDMRAYASRGQARTLALALRLAEAAYLESRRGEGPVVLLDDVLSEMDYTRRRRVMEHASRFQQTLITTTGMDDSRSFFGPLARFFRVHDGRVTPLPNENAAHDSGAALPETVLE